MAQEAPIIYTNKEKLLTYITVLLGLMFDGYTLLITSYVLQPMASYFHVTIAVIAFALTLVLISSVIGGISFGWLADRIGRRPTLFITILVFGITTLITGFVNSIPEFYLFRFLGGLGLGGEYGIGYTLLNEAYSERVRGKAGGLLNSMFVWGSLIGSATAGYTISTFGSSLGWRYAYFIAGGAAIVLIIMRIFTPESKVWQRYMKYKKEGKLPPGYVAKSSLVDIFSRKYIRYTLFGTLMTIGYLFAQYSYLSFIPTYFFTVYKIPVLTYTEIVIIASLVGGVGGDVVIGFVSDSIGRKKTAIIYGVLTILAVIWFLVEAETKPTFISIWSFPVFYAYMLIQFAGGFIGQFGVWIGEHFETRVRATGSNFAYVVGRGLGGALAPILVPILAIDYGSLGIAISIGMLIGGIIQFIAIFGLKETKGTMITPL